MKVRKVGRCRQEQNNEFASVDDCDQGVMDILVAPDDRKYPPK